MLGLLNLQQDPLKGLETGLMLGLLSFSLYQEAPSGLEIGLMLGLLFFSL